LITYLRDTVQNPYLSHPHTEGMKLQQAISLVNTIVRSSTLETPVKRYIERSGAALKRTSAEIALLRKKVNEARELLRVRRGRKNGKRVAIAGKFVFNKKEILELVEEAEKEALNKEKDEKEANDESYNTRN
jgi:hypothetical protein